MKKVDRTKMRPDQKNPHDQTEVANSVDHKRLLRRGGRRWFMEPETNQQITAETDHFPENKQLGKVIRQHQHAHRKNEH